MSPKKGARSKKKSTEKERIVHKEKAVKNKPANLKVSIPLLNTEKEGLTFPIVKGRRPPLFTKKLDNETKVELANSVARLQLVKEEPPVFQEDNLVFINAPKPRGRKRKVTFSNVLQNGVCENNTAEVITMSENKDAPDKIPITENKPIPENKPILENKPLPENKPKSQPRRILTRKRPADSKPPKVTKRLKVGQVTETVKNIEESAQSVELPVVPESQQPTTLVVIAKQEPVKPQRRGRRSKSTVKELTVDNPIVDEPIVDESTVDEPTVVESTVDEPTIAVPPVKEPIAKKPAAKKTPLKKQTTSVKKRGRQGKPKNGPNSDAIPLVDLLKNKIAETANQKQKDIPGLVESRKSSVGSSRSSKSWTRDISSSSNNTFTGSFCTNDFVRINKKLPVLKLTNIDNEVKKRQNQAREVVVPAAVQEIDETSSSDSDSDSDTDSERYYEQINDSMGAHSLHLSTSSSSQFIQSCRKVSNSDYYKNNSSGSQKTNSLDYKKAADQLNLTMKKLDLEMIEWMSFRDEDVNANILKFKAKMFDILDREFGVITHCQHLREMLDPDKNRHNLCEDCDDTSHIKNVLIEKSPENASVETRTYLKENNKIKESSTLKENTKIKESSAVKESTIVKENLSINENTKEVVADFVVPKRRPSRLLSRTSEGNVSTASTRVETDEEMEANTSHPYYDHHDDDDTLSLFAESISGFESSRMTSAPSVVVSKPRPIEEYIPQHVKADYLPNIERQSYCPTKIREEPETMAFNEKYIADSTSINKQSVSTDDAESYQDFHENIDLDTKPDPPDVAKKPHLMDSYFEGMPKAKSIVFGNLCFYNLMNCCRKARTGQCRFMHLIPTREQIKEKLSHLDERLLIQEYLLLRKWGELRRKYGICYAEECDKRRLTRILVEMAYDFIVKARSESEEDTQLRVATIELTLLHLNNVDLNICEDLLKLPIHSDQTNRTLLCDVFMATMSITQNFSRFKIVFLTLTYFMVENDRSFNKDVVEHILERVCILPFEEPIAKALIQMMRLTKPEIFNNSMIGHFEQQISVSKAVFDEYTVLKSQYAFSSMLASSLVTDGLNLKEDMSARPDSEPSADSPDTTTPNTAAEETPKPIITRTIGMNPLMIFNTTRTSPGASQGYSKNDTSQAFVNPGTSQAAGNTGASQVFGNPGTSQGFGNTNTSQGFGNTGTSQGFNPGSSQGFGNGISQGFGNGNSQGFGNASPGFGNGNAPGFGNPGSSSAHDNPGTSQPYVNNAGTDASDDSVQKIRQWRNRCIFPHRLPVPMAHRPSMRGTPTRGTSTRGLSRPPMRPHMRPPQRMPFNQRLVTFKSPSNFLKRPPGPNY